MKKIQALLFRTGPILSARIIQLVFGFLVTFIVASWLPPTELGVYYMATAISIGCHFILLNSLHFPIQRLMPDERSRRREYLSTVFLVSFFFLIATLALFSILKLEGAGGDFVILFLICISFAFSETIFSQVTNVTSAKRQVILYFFVVLMRSSVIFSLFLVFRPDGPSADTAILFFVLGNLAASCCLLVVNHDDFSVKLFSWSVIKENFVFSRAYSVSNIFVQVISRGDRLLIGMMLGPIASGIYSVASDLSRRTLQGICVNSRLAFVRDAVEAYVEKDEKATEASIYNILSSVLVVGVPAASVLSVFSADIFQKILPEQIIDGSGLLWRIAPFVFLCEALRSYSYSLPFELSKRTSLETLVTATGCVIFLLLILPFVRFWGLEGAALALAVTFNVMIVQSIILARVKVGIRVPVVVSYLSLTFACASAFVLGEGAWWWSGMPLVKLIGLAALYGIFMLMCQASICYLLRPKGRI